MSRFCTPEQVIEHATRAAADDYRRHTEYGIDLNPFCTQGARHDWQRGFDNAGPSILGITIEFNTIYQRGRAAALIVEQQGEQQ